MRPPARAFVLVAFVACAPSASTHADSDSEAATSAREIAGVTFTVPKGQFMGAKGNGGSSVIATATVAKTWETFTLVDTNGGTLASGDLVFLRAGGGEYFRAIDGGGSGIDVTATTPRDWETFRIVRAAGAGDVRTGDVVGLQTANGHWVSAANSGGSDVFAYGASFGAWEHFVIGMPAGGPSDPIACDFPFPDLTSAASGSAMTAHVGAPSAIHAPDRIGVNIGPYEPGSNTSLWLQYLGVNAGRLFLTMLPSLHSLVSAPQWGRDLSGAAVQDATAFEAAVTRLRASSRAAQKTAAVPVQYDAIFAHAKNIGSGPVPFTVDELARLGIEPLAELGLSDDVLAFASYDRASAAFWNDAWVYFEYTYAAAAILAEHGVRAFETFNEPDIKTSGLVQSEWATKHVIAARAIQAAVADTANGAKAFVTGPAGVASKDYRVISGGDTRDDESGVGWGELIARDRRHELFPAVAATANYDVLQRYAFHVYSHDGALMRSELADLAGQIASDAKAEGNAVLPIEVTEFNVRTAGTLDGTTDTLDTPHLVAMLGGQLAGASKDGHARGLYVFRMQESADSGCCPTSGIKKNGIMRSETSGMPYSIGGSTLAGEAFALFARHVTPGTALRPVTLSPARAGVFAIAATESDSVVAYLVNDSANAIALNLAVDGAAGGGCANAVGSVVDASSRGEVALAAPLAPSSTGATASLVLPAESVTLVSVPLNGGPLATRAVMAVGDATVASGSTAHQGGDATLTSGASTTSSSAVLLDFGAAVNDVSRAVLELTVAQAGNTENVLHVYAVDTAFDEGSVTFAHAPGVRAGSGAVRSMNDGIVDPAAARLLGSLTIAAHATSAKARLDVTSAYRDGKAPKALLVVREKQSAGDALGSVSFGSRESATPPRLVVTTRSGS